jgi:two-component system, LytTR family, response regulator
MPIRTLIVDDEPHARARIRSLLASHPGVDVVGECEGGEDAIAAIRSLRPELLFLDVQLRGCSAFDVIGAVGAADLPVTVFVSAYGEHAIEAFDVEAADYLLKPFDATRFRRALDRARARLAAEQPPEPRTSDAQGTAGRLEWFMLRGSTREVRLVRAEDVDWIEACGNYVFVHVGETRHLYRHTMAALEARLDPDRFVRIHRSTIVNLFAIRSLEPIYAGDYDVRLKNGRALRMSRSYRDALERVTGRAG